VLSVNVGRPRTFEFKDASDRRSSSYCYRQ